LSILSVESEKKAYLYLGTYIDEGNK
jgi:hypothetical protein